MTKVNPTPQVMVMVREPKESNSRDFMPITDPENVKQFIETYFADIPVMKKIAQCESHFRHYNKQGEIQRGEKNQSDVGVMQVNEWYHIKEAKALGLNLHDLDDNVAFARRLYERSGTKPWNSSSPCWSKMTSDLAINSVPTNKVEN